MATTRWSPSQATACGARKGLFDAVEGGAARVEISDNASDGDYQARIAQYGVPLAAGHGYLLTFRAKGEAERRGYTNLQVPGGELFMNQPVHYAVGWRDYEFPWVQASDAPTEGAKFEIGFGGQAATGSTWFDGLEIRDLGAGACQPAVGELANGGFSQSYLCWQLSRPWDEVRFEAVTDTTTFGDASPSVRLEYEPLSGTSGVLFSQTGLSFKSGKTYAVSFKVKSAAGATPAIAVSDDETGTALWETLDVGTDWMNVTRQFTFSSATPGKGAVEIQLDSASDVTLWLDDFKVSEIQAF